MILVVDDNPGIRDLFCETLGEAGYSVTTVDTGEGAADILRNNAVFDLVLMDLSLPDIDGAEVARRYYSAGGTVPMIAVSGALALMDPAKIAAAGFVATLPKPLRLSSLLALVGRHASPG